MREPEAPGICFTASFIVPRQLRSIDGWIPSSVATCARGRPLDASSDTASRLNSSVNARRVVVFVVINAPRPFQELTRGVHSFGGGSPCLAMPHFRQGGAAMGTPVSTADLVW